MAKVDAVAAWPEIVALGEPMIDFTGPIRIRPTTCRDLVATSPTWPLSRHGRARAWGSSPAQFAMKGLVRQYGSFGQTGRA